MDGGVDRGNDDGIDDGVDDGINDGDILLGGTSDKTGAGGNLKESPIRRPLRKSFFLEFFFRKIPQVDFDAAQLLLVPSPPRDCRVARALQPSCLLTL